MNRKKRRKPNKKSPRSIYWCDRADDEITRLYRGLPCIICGTREGTYGHHLITRACKSLRHNLDNIVPLCHKHHIFDNQLSAHRATAAFHFWLEKNWPEKYEWLRAHINHTSQPNFLEAYIKLGNMDKIPEKYYTCQSQNGSTPS